MRVSCLVAKLLIVSRMSKVDKINQEKKIMFSILGQNGNKDIDLSISHLSFALWKTIKKYNFSIILMSVEPSKLKFL